MGQSNNSVMMVERVFRDLPEVLEQMRFDVTEGRLGQTEACRKYRDLYPDRFSGIKDQRFSDWAKVQIREWMLDVRACRRLTIGQRMRQAGQAAPISEQGQQLTQAFGGIIQEMVVDPNSDPDTMELGLRAIDTLTRREELEIKRLKIENDRLKLELQQNKDRRDEESHQAKMAQLKAAMNKVAAKTADGKLDKAEVFDVVDKLMRGELI